MYSAMVSSNEDLMKHNEISIFYIIISVLSVLRST